MSFKFTRYPDDKWPLSKHLISPKDSNLSPCSALL